MISSQDGTEDRLPRAALRPWRAACSLTGSVDSEAAEGASSAGDGGEVTGVAAGSCLPMSLGGPGFFCGRSVPLWC